MVAGVAAYRRPLGLVRVACCFQSRVTELQRSVSALSPFLLSPPSISSPSPLSPRGKVDGSQCHRLPAFAGEFMDFKYDAFVGPAFTALTVCWTGLPRLRCLRCCWYWVTGLPTLSLLQTTGPGLPSTASTSSSNCTFTFAILLVDALPFIGVSWRLALVATNK